MTAKRYAILNKNGVCVNVILIDDPVPANYYPGYGAYMVCLQGTPDIVRGSGLPVVTVTPDKPLSIGDTINLETGVVTKFVSQSIQHNDGRGILTARSAPSVRIIKDADPTTDGSLNSPVLLRREPDGTYTRR